MNHELSVACQIVANLCFVLIQLIARLNDAQRQTETEEQGKVIFWPLDSIWGVDNSGLRRPKVVLMEEAGWHTEGKELKRSTV